MCLPVSLVSVIALCCVSLPVHAQEQVSFLVKGEEPKLVEFRVPANSPYKFQYDPARIALWGSASKRSKILSGKEFPARRGDPDCQSDSTDFTCVPLFVEGAGGGSDIEPVVIEVLTRLPDGTFEPVGRRFFRLTTITVSPTSGSLGSVITIELEPAVPPVVFGPSATIEWTGVFQPIVGPPSDPFTIAYSTQQVRDSSASNATIIIGDGSGLPAIPSQGVPPGTFVGKLNILLPGQTLCRSFSFQIAGTLIDWFRLDYPEDEFGVLDDPPALSVTPLDTIPIYVVPSVGAVPEFLSVAFFFHTACVLLLDENSITAAEAPTSFAVDLVSLDSSGVEVDRVSGVVLMLDNADGDPDHLTYHSNLATPIVHVAGIIDKEQFPDQIILLASNGGTVTVLESAP